MDKEKKAIERLKYASEMSFQIYQKPLLVTTSGGKDSDVCLHLVKKSGIPFEVSHSHTTVDAPETVMHVREQFKELELGGIKCDISYPYYKGQRVTMWSLIPMKKIPPTRTVRYCCSVMKETAGKDRFITTGVRWAESVKRRDRAAFETITPKKENRIVFNEDNDENRRLFETCQLNAKRTCNPIIDWGDQEIWEYIKSEKIQTNPLYKCGFYRVGCIGCPLAGKKTMQKGFAMYPAYERAYIRAFDKMIRNRTSRGESGEWKTGLDVFHWWVEDGVLPGQVEFGACESVQKRIV